MKSIGINFLCYFFILKIGGSTIEMTIPISSKRNQTFIQMLKEYISESLDEMPLQDRYCIEIVLDEFEKVFCAGSVSAIVNWGGHKGKISDLWITNRDYVRWIKTQKDIKKQHPEAWAESNYLCSI
jgi:hypothetical protein